MTLTRGCAKRQKDDDKQRDPAVSQFARTTVHRRTHVTVTVNITAFNQRLHKHSSIVPAWGRAISRPEGLDHNEGPSAIPCGSSQSWILNWNLRDFFYKSRDIPDCCSIYICGV